MTIAIIIVCFVAYLFLVKIGIKYVVAPWAANEFPLSWRDGEVRGMVLFWSATLTWILIVLIWAPVHWAVELGYKRHLLRNFVDWLIGDVEHV